MFYFTDLYGPRLTGSPNHVNAEKWAADEMKRWGFDYTGLEPWDFGHPGWVNDYNTGVMLSPSELTVCPATSPNPTATLMVTLSENVVWKNCATALTFTSRKISWWKRSVLSSVRVLTWKC